MNSWLPLTDYSTKYKVSVSTLRRRIKADDIKFRFEDGKYFISDEPAVGTHQRAHRPSQDSDFSLMGTHFSKPVVEVAPPAPPVAKVQVQQPAQQQVPPTPVAQPMANMAAQVNKDEPILTAANKLLNELKKAYSLILQEKEEQILQLKSELADLKTLVRVLESENDRLKFFKQ